MLAGMLGTSGEWEKRDGELRGRGGEGREGRREVKGEGEGNARWSSGARKGGFLGVREVG